MSYLTKFENDLAFALYALDPDEDYALPDGGGWYSLVSHVEDHEVTQFLLREGQPRLGYSVQGESFVIHEDEQGFVVVLFRGPKMKAEEFFRELVGEETEG
jgi:hypothetical protein